MKPIKVSTIVTICVGLTLGLAFYKWVLLPILITADITGRTTTIMSYAIVPLAIVYALHLLVRDMSPKKENDNEQT